MKKKSFSLLFAALFAAVSLVFVSCDDDDDNGGSNTAQTGNIAGEYSTDLTLDADNTYTLDGACIINDGATLTIPAGTVITAKGGTTSYIAIAQGGKIMVEGTAT